MCTKSGLLLFSTYSCSSAKNVRPDVLTPKLKPVGEKMYRTAVRKHLIKNVYDYCNDDGLYDEFLDKLIAFEESLVEDIS